MADSRRRGRGRGTVPSCCAWRRAVAAAGVLALGRRGALADVCVLSTGQTDITIGQPTAVCLVVNPLVWQVGGDELDEMFYSQVLILPDADDFSRFSVKGSWNNSAVTQQDPILTTFGTEVGVHVESMGKYSFQRAFRLHEERKTFPIHTAIINVEQGEVTGISWDDGCHFCGSDQCQENAYDFNGELIQGDGSSEDCFWPDSSCVMDGNDGKVSSLCQLTVYVVWSGTDANGNYFTSFSKRLSMYAGETVDSFIDSVADEFEDTIQPAT
ncbi:unnamed protein product [Pylaiella littoralis]